ncbi:MAG TPA: efflux transporter outer membrane subunit [Anaerohalosphaeraceae bacterium]|nr:efflux transporter outer membrane subunit [Anaerohalosphaeraceae bacterium]
MMNASVRGFLVLLPMGMIFTAGCRVGPDYQPPKPQMPAAWSRLEDASAPSPDLFKHWWTVLDDPVLEGLIQQALESNLSLQESYFRIQEARALRDAAAGGRYPSVGASGSYTRSRQSENTAFAYGGGTEISTYSASLDALWELDLFGQIRRSVEAAQASLEATVESERAVRVSLCAEVASVYVELRTTQLRLRYALQNLQTQQETLRLTYSRFDAGLAPELDVAQARQNLANTEAQIPLLRLAEQQAIHRLAVLLGRFPRDFEIGAARADLIPTPSEGGIPPTVPADLLRQRPDIRRAERQLAAQSARIGIAAAQLYPSLSLSGVFGLSSEHFSDLGRWSSRTFSFGPRLDWNLFAGGRLRRLVEAEKARFEQLYSAYEQTVLAAVEEVENAIAAYARHQERLGALRRSAAAAEDAVRLVEALYRNGLTDFQNVLDAQRTLYAQQDSLAAGEGAVVLDLIRLYKALGGGWDPSQEQNLPSSAESQKQS